MEVLPPTGPAVPAIPGAHGNTKVAPGKLAESARDFEALLITQVLKTALTSESMGLSENEAGGHAVQFAAEEFGRAIAAQGGMGLSRLVLQGLERSGGSE